MVIRLYEYLFMNKKKYLILILNLSAILILGLSIFYNDASAKVSLNRKSVTLKVGKKYTLRVKNTKKKVKWKSNNKRIATINSKGIVKAKRAGKTRVYARVSGKKLYCKIIVKKSKKVSGTYYNFRYPSYLTEHYNKHGIEMGYKSEKSYLDAANALINNPDALHKLEAEDHDHIYYLESTNEIVFLSQDGFIRTYFICSGKDYFDRQ